MDFVREILQSCQLEEYLQKFIDNCIDDQSLKLIDDDAIKDLMPIIGHRLKFKAALKKWNTENDSLVNISDLEFYIPNENCGIITDNQPSQITIPIESDNSAAKPNKILAESSEVSVHSPIAPCSLSSSSDTSSSDGRAILTQGIQSEGSLKESDRRRLSQIIVWHLLENNPCTVISSNEFQKIAIEIQKLFPKENAVIYFSPYEVTTTGRKKNASGKLYETYISRRRKLRSRGELPGTSRSSNSSSASTASALTTTLSNRTDEDISDDNETCLEKLTWLKNSVDPWRIVEEYWKDTFKSRIKVVKQGLGNIRDYYTDYPALQQPQGYLLLLQDFDSLYQKNDGLYSNIVLLRENIVSLAHEKKKKLRDKDLINIISNYINLATNSEPETLSNVALLLIAYIIGNSQSQRRGKCHWKPSRSEIRDGFITQAASEAEVTSIIETRRAKLSRLNRTLQPFIIYVGESVALIKNCYVVIDNTCYAFLNLITAVDTAFKIFHATGACYPEESINIWLVIQIGFYKIKTVYDRPNQAVNSLLNDLGLLD